MALRLIVWASDKFADNSVRPQRSDVVEILDSSIDPGSGVLQSGDYRIIELPPSVTFDQVAHLLVTDVVTARGEQPGMALPQTWFRRSGVNLDSFDSAAALKLGRMLSKTDIVQASLKEVADLAVTKLPMPHPQVIA